MATAECSKLAVLMKVTILASTAGLAAALLIAASTLIVVPRTAEATPQFAQQTGQPCGKCHTTPPTLNSYGKSFKSRSKK